LCCTHLYVLYNTISRRFLFYLCRLIGRATRVTYFIVYRAEIMNILFPNACLRVDHAVSVQLFAPEMISHIMYLYRIPDRYNHGIFSQRCCITWYTIVIYQTLRSEDIVCVYVIILIFAHRRDVCSAVLVVRSHYIIIRYYIRWCIHLYIILYYYYMYVVCDGLLRCARSHKNVF